MLRQQFHIQLHYEEAIRRKSKMKDFYRDCMFLIEKYDELYFIEEMRKCKNKINVYLARRKNNNPHISGTKSKNLYKDELKEQRRYLKTLKYLIIDEKKFTNSRSELIRPCANYKTRN